MVISKDEYKCRCCNEIWGFVPEDYDIDKMPYPTICPLCCMSLKQLISETIIGEVDLLLAVKVLISRLKRKLFSSEDKPNGSK